jgi:hypothetical protein
MKKLNLNEHENQGRKKEFSSWEHNLEKEIVGHGR